MTYERIIGGVVLAGGLAFALARSLRSGRSSPAIGSRRPLDDYRDGQWVDAARRVN